MYHIDATVVSRAVNATWSTSFWCRWQVLPSTCDLYLVTEQGECDRLGGSSNFNANLAFVTEHPDDLSQSAAFSELAFSVVLRHSSELGQVLWERTSAHGKRTQARTLGSSTVLREPFATPQLPLVKQLLPAWRPPPIVNPRPSHMARMIESSLRQCRPLAARGPQSKKRAADERSDRRVVTMTNSFVVDPVVVSVEKAATSDAQLGIDLVADASARVVVLSVVAESPAAFFIEARDVIVAVGGVLCKSSEHATQLLRDAPAGWVDILKGRCPGRPRHESADECMGMAEEDQLQTAPSVTCRKACQSDLPHLRDWAPNAGHWTLMPPAPGPRGGSSGP